MLSKLLGRASGSWSAIDASDAEIDAEEFSHIAGLSSKNDGSSSPQASLSPNNGGAPKTRPRSRSDIPNAGAQTIRDKLIGKSAQKAFQPKLATSANRGSSHTLPIAIGSSSDVKTGVSPTSPIKLEPIEKHMLPHKPDFKYKKGDVIGKGGFGKVYTGTIMPSGELIAIKHVKLHSTKAHHDQKIRSLLKEIQLMRHLNHPNIVRYLGVESTPKYINIFLEYVNRGSLEKELRELAKKYKEQLHKQSTTSDHGSPIHSRITGLFSRKSTESSSPTAQSPQHHALTCKGFPESLIRTYTRQILEGLAYLHENGIVHRDIKCGNVLIDTRGVIKLADFGISTSLQDIQKEEDRVWGSPPWMSPEQMSQGKSGFASDIWSVGCTVIEMALGEDWYAQFSGKTPQQMAYYIQSHPNWPPIPDELSPQAKDFLHRCFNSDPEKRATACELLHHPFVVEQLNGDEMENTYTDSSAVPTFSEDFADVPTELDDDEDPNFDDDEDFDYSNPSAAHNDKELDAIPSSSKVRRKLIDDSDDSDNESIAIQLAEATDILNNVAISPTSINNNNNANGSSNSSNISEAVAEDINMTPPDITVTADEAWMKSDGGNDTTT